MKTTEQCLLHRPTLVFPLITRSPCSLSTDEHSHHTRDDVYITPRVHCSSTAVLVYLRRCCVSSPWHKLNMTHLLWPVFSKEGLKDMLRAPTVDLLCLREEGGEYDSMKSARLHLQSSLINRD